MLFEVYKKGIKTCLCEFDNNLKVPNLIISYKFPLYEQLSLLFKLEVNTDEHLIISHKPSVIAYCHWRKAKGYQPFFTA